MSARGGERLPVVTLQEVRPTDLGGECWSALVGPLEVEYSYAHAVAMQLHPLNDGADGRIAWWLARADGRPVGLFTALVTETLNLGALMSVEIAHLATRLVNPIYVRLNRRGLFRRLLGTPVGELLRLLSGRPRIVIVGTHGADANGHGIGDALRRLPPAAYLPPLLAAIERLAADHRAEQILFREVPESDVGPLRFPDLWAVPAPDPKDARRGAGLLRAAGYRRSPGLPAAYFDLRALHAVDGTAAGFLERYRHRSARDAARFLQACQRWRAAPARERYPLRRPPATRRLERLRLQSFRSGILPPELPRVLAREARERSLAALTARQAALAEERRRLAVDGQSAREAVARIVPPDQLEQVLRAVATARLSGSGASGPDLQDLEEAAALVQQVTALEAQVEPALAAVPSRVRRKVLALARADGHHPRSERELLYELGGRRAGQADADGARARLDDLLAAAVRTLEPATALAAARARLGELRARTGVAPEEVQAVLSAERLLSSVEDGSADGAALRAAAQAVALAAERRRAHDRRAAAVSAKLAAATQALADDRPDDGFVRDLREECVATFRREQDRIVARRGGHGPLTPETRRALLLEACSYRSFDYDRLLRSVESIRDVDRSRLVAEHEAHRQRVLAAFPDQPGPATPEFDRDGYLASPLRFSPDDPRVWDNLADQDQITWLYHLTMARSKIRHDVVDWPYFDAYRRAGIESGDELGFATLRAGGPDGPLIGALSVRRSAGGHVRPERIAIERTRFGAYHTLTLLTMAWHFERGGTFVTLGPTAWGTKLRELGAEFSRPFEYVRFRGPAWERWLLEFARRRTYARIRIERILDIAALPPEQAAIEARRAGLRFHV